MKRHIPDDNSGKTGSEISVRTEVKQVIFPPDAYNSYDEMIGKANNGFVAFYSTEKNVTDIFEYGIDQDGNLKLKFEMSFSKRLIAFSGLNDKLVCDSTVYFRRAGRWNLFQKLDVPDNLLGGACFLCNDNVVVVINQHYKIVVFLYQGQKQYARMQLQYTRLDWKKQGQLT